MNQVLIGDLSSQFFMHHRFLEPTFQFRHDKFGGIFFQMKKIQFFRKTVFRDLIPIQQGKNQPITNQRLKHFCKIKT